MLHAKFQDHRTSCYGEEDFFKVFTIYGHGGYLGYVTWTILYTFVPPSQGRSTLNLALIGQAVSEENMFKIVKGRRRTTPTDDGRTPNYGYTISLPCGSDCSGELKKLVENFWYLSYFCSKHTLWVHVKTVSVVKKNKQK